MEEARRFLRYVMLGLIFLIELIICISISSYDDLLVLLSKLYGGDKDTINGIVFVGVLFFGSGGIGFMFSVIYHLMVHKGLRFVNHKPLILNTVKFKYIKILKNGDEQCVVTGEDLKKISKSDAWCMVVSYWHERRESSKRIKGANPRIDSLTDIYHGLGTTWVGTIMFLFMWWYFYGLFSSSALTFIIYLKSYIFPVIVCGVLGLNYYLTGVELQKVVDNIMIDEIREDYNKHKEPIIFYLQSNSYKAPPCQ